MTANAPSFSTKTRHAATNDKNESKYSNAHPFPPFAYTSGMFVE